MRFLLVEAGLIGALFGALVDLVGGAADLAGEGREPGFLGLADAEVLGGGEAVGVVGQFVVLDGDGEPDLEQVERFEQEVVGGRGGDLAPV